jgi:hypothetical protein
MGKTLTLTSNIKLSVTYVEDDFENKKEFNKFLKRVKSDKSYMFEVFLESWDSELLISELEAQIDDMDIKAEFDNEP